MPPPCCSVVLRGSLIGAAPGETGIGGVVAGCAPGVATGRLGSVVAVAVGATLVGAPTAGADVCGAVTTAGAGLVVAAALGTADTGAPATGDGETVTTPDASDNNMAFGICAVTSSAAM